MCSNVIHVNMRQNVHRSLGSLNRCYTTCDCHDNDLKIVGLIKYNTLNCYTKNVLQTAFVSLVVCLANCFC